MFGTQEWWVESEMLSCSSGEVRERHFEGDGGRFCVELEVGGNYIGVFDVGNAGHVYKRTYGGDCAGTSLHLVVGEFF